MADRVNLSHCCFSSICRRASSLWRRQARHWQEKGISRHYTMHDLFIVDFFFLYSEVSPIELQEALRHLDPAKPPDELYLIISKAFSLPLERVGSQLQLEGAEQQGLATPISKVLQRLNRFGTYRSGPRPQYDNDNNYFVCSAIISISPLAISQ